MAESKPVHVSKVELPALKRGHVIGIDHEIGETSQGRDQIVISVDQKAQTQSCLVQPSGREERCYKIFEEEEEEENKVRTQSKTPKIQKVIFLLRDHEHYVKIYEPRVVSLGPIHHGKERYRLAETIKLKLAKKFVKSSGKTIEELCKAVEEKIEELRKCFEEEVTKKYKDVDLAWILVVDGCAILQYIDLAVKDNFSESGTKNDSVAFFQQDLFLLENQVPYELLELLMSLSNVGNELRDSVKIFIKRNHDHMVRGDKSSDPLLPENGRPTHLLDLLRSSLLGPGKKIDNPKENGNTEAKQQTNLQETKASNEKTTTRSSNGTKGRNRLKTIEWQSYRKMQELKAAGIHVERSEDNSLRGVYFTIKFFFLGFLSLPLLIVDDSTGPKLLNLIAYEMCPDFDNDSGITSYVSFLDSLIDEVNDVKELRKAQVLLNLLGSDEEVAQLFNEIGTDLVPNLREYEDVKWQIQKYYDNKIMVWMAQLFQDIFSRPWKIVAFFGSLSALVLTATQTLRSPSGPCDDFCKKFSSSLS